MKENSKRKRYMSDKKVIFFDIDGTVWDWKGIIPESAKATIRELDAKGHIPMICSGRSKGHIVDKELLSLGFRGIVAACGDYVEIDGDVIYENILPESVVRKIIQSSLDCNVPVVLEGSKYHCISTHGFEKDGFVDRMWKVMGECAVPLLDYRADMKINKFSGDVINDSDYETFYRNLSPYFTFIEHGLTSDLNPKPGRDYNEIVGVFESVPPGSSKANGIKIACDYLKTDIADTFALGDSNNDIEMIKYVNTGIAMGNASPGLKEVADYITDDIWSDGLKKAMEHFNLI